MHKAGINAPYRATIYLVLEDASMVKGFMAADINARDAPGANVGGEVEGTLAPDDRGAVIHPDCRRWVNWQCTVEEPSIHVHINRMLRPFRSLDGPAPVRVVVGFGFAFFARYFGLKAT